MTPRNGRRNMTPRNGRRNMTEESPFDYYVDALRDDLPSARDEARIREKLIGAGLGLSLVTSCKVAVAGAPVAKAGVFSTLAERFMSLSGVPQFCLTTAVTTAVITGPLWIATRPQESPSVTTSSSVARVSAAAKQLRTPELTPAPTPVTAPQISEVPPTANVTRMGRSLKVAPRPPDDAPTETSVDSSALSEETRLIDEALLAIRAGDLDLAARRLDDHQSRFAAGKLARERERARQKLQEARLQLHR